MHANVHFTGNPSTKNSAFEAYIHRNFCGKPYFYGESLSDSLHKDAEIMRYIHERPDDPPTEKYAIKKLVFLT